MRGNRFIDETGKRYGRLLVLEVALSRKSKAPLYRCKCDCGNETMTDGTKLRNGDKRSCGCLRRETTRELGHRSTHGLRYVSEYRIWSSMKNRCLNENNMNYNSYGGRGVSVCEQWLESFETFLEDMEPRPSLDHSIDRVDVNGDYTPENCRWATRAEQNNNRRTSRWIEFEGRKQTLADWAREIGVSPQCLSARLKRWTLKEALTTPKGDDKHDAEAA